MAFPPSAGVTCVQSFSVASRGRLLLTPACRPGVCPWGTVTAPGSCTDRFVTESEIRTQHANTHVLLHTRLEVRFQT